MSLPVRLGLYYSAIFLVAGAAAPYMPVWFEARGLSGAEIGLILAAPMMGRMVSAPLLAVWADSFRLRRTPMILLAAIAGAAYALMAAPLGFWGWFLVWFAAGTVYSMLSPLTDVITLRRAALDGFNFGWPRGIGSAAYILANVGMGWLLVRTSPDWVLGWVIGWTVLSVAAGRFLLPADAVGEAPTRLSERLAGLGGLLRDPQFLLAVLVIGLVQSAHAFYYGFSALAWKAQGIPESLTGVLWGVGVAVEVAFLWFLEPWRRRVGPRRLLVLGSSAAVVRWFALAFSPPLWLLFPLQALHTLSFAATFMASLQIVERLSTPANASAAQAINSAFSGGLLIGLATLASGALYDAFGARGYLAMALMAGLGLLGALRLYGVQRLDA